MGGALGERMANIFPSSGYYGIELASTPRARFNDRPDWRGFLFGT